MTKPCECPLAGWCKRHKRQKGPNAWKLCQTSEDYRELWDRQAAGLPTIQPPSTVRRVVNFTLAAIAHLVRGNPTCDQEQIDQRLKVCRACQWFSAELQMCQHPQCGCSINSERRFLNKLAWADQACPVGKW